jgi:hypothetical protein
MKGAFATAVVCALALASSRPAVAEELPCDEIAALDGDAALVGRVGEILGELGVIVRAPDEGCAAVRATVQPDPDGVAVMVRSGGGRLEGRVVTDARVAATWIESWLRAGAIDAPLMAARPLPSMVAAASKPAISMSRPALEPPGEVAARPSLGLGTDTSGEATPTGWRGWLGRIAVGAGIESTSADDDSSWRGFQVAVCTIYRGACLGARVRYLGQDAWTVPALYGSADRRSTEITATAALPWQVGRMTVAPSVGLGVGWMRSARHGPLCANALGELLESPDCDPNVDWYVSDGFGVTTLAPRLDTALAVSVELIAHVWLEGQLSVGVALGAHRDPHVDDGDGMMDPGNVFPELTSLPGEPASFLRAGVGLRIGGR